MDFNSGYPWPQDKKFRNCIEFLHWRCSDKSLFVAVQVIFRFLKVYHPPAQCDLLLGAVNWSSWAMLLRWWKQSAPAYQCVQFTFLSCNCNWQFSLSLVCRLPSGVVLSLLVWCVVGLGQWGPAILSWLPQPMGNLFVAGRLLEETSAVTTLLHQWYPEGCYRSVCEGFGFRGTSSGVQFTTELLQFCWLQLSLKHLSKCLCLSKLFGWGYKGL